MALTLAADTDRVIDLDELLDYLDTQVNVHDEASLCSAAPMLRALANNRRFLANRIAAELADTANFQNESSYFSRALVLARQADYTIRAVVWLPGHEAESEPVDLSGDGTLVGMRNSIYGLVHNHAFPFLTVGYWGPGYETDIYECPDGGDEHEIGTPLRLHFLERTRLSPGKVMYYRAFVDAHVQRPPESLSVSLNILVSSDAQTLRDQYDLDLHNGEIADVLGRGNEARVALCDFAGVLGSARTPALLRELARSHPAGRVRTAAQRARQHLTTRPD